MSSLTDRVKGWLGKDAERLHRMNTIEQSMAFRSLAQKYEGTTGSRDFSGLLDPIERIVQEHSGSMPAARKARAQAERTLRNYDPKRPKPRFVI